MALPAVAPIVVRVLGSVAKKAAGAAVKAAASALKGAGSGAWTVTVNGIGQTEAALQSLAEQYGGDAVWVAGPTVSYAIHNEYGTSKMEARPFMRPAAERVDANLEHHVKKVAQSSGLSLTSHDDAVRAAALAVQNEAKKIADRKDIRDTGTLINSISVERIQ